MSTRTAFEDEKGIGSGSRRNLLSVEFLAAQAVSDAGLVELDDW